MSVVRPTCICCLAIHDNLSPESSVLLAMGSLVVAGPELAIGMMCKAHAFELKASTQTAIERFDRAVSGHTDIGPVN